MGSVKRGAGSASNLPAFVFHWRLPISSFPPASRPLETVFFPISFERP